MKVGKC